MIRYSILTSPQDKRHLKDDFGLFFHEIYGQPLSDVNWEHQFIRSPYEDSALFIAFENDTIIGSSLMIPQKYHTPSKSGAYYLWTTSAVAKPYRTKGVYAKLLAMQRQFAEEHTKDFIFAFPNKLAYPVVKLFGGFKDLANAMLVKTTWQHINFEYAASHNTLVMDAPFISWRFEHNNYRFYRHQNYIVIAKPYQDAFDVLAVYRKETFEGYNIPIKSEPIQGSIVTLSTFLNEDAEYVSLDTIRGVYFPINQEVAYDAMSINLLMSDVF